uniref:UBC core domain-containing protein n=1 Tax=Leptobrachium leishanense TaxID=445787 RepID=A0A8C5M4N7_9ANUR
MPALTVQRYEFQHREFATIFHPHISSNGGVCAHALKTDLKAGLGVRHILLPIQCLLFHLKPELAQNEDPRPRTLRRTLRPELWYRVLDAMGLVFCAPPVMIHCIREFIAPTSPKDAM